MGGARHGWRPGRPQGKSTDTANGTRGQWPIVQGDRDRGRGARRIRACIKGGSQAAGCELFPKLRRLDNYQRARCASRCGRRRPGSSRCAVCAACRLSGAEYTLPPRGGGVIRGALYSCAGRAGLRAALTARDLTPAWSGREESNPARGRVPGRPQAPSRLVANG